MGSRQIVLVSTPGFSVLNTGIFWREAKTKRPFSQCKGTFKRIDFLTEAKSKVPDWGIKLTLA
jgi:hypothetical protein